MRVRPERRDRPAARRAVLVAGLCGLAGCSTAPQHDERPPASPAASSDLPAGEAAEDAESTGAEALASVEAELAEYEARLAKAGVRVRRDQRGAASTAAPAEAFDQPADESEPEPEPTLGEARDQASAKRPATRRPSKAKPSRGVEKKGSGDAAKRERRNKRDDRAAPPPPAGPRSEGSEDAAPDAGAVGGALADGDADASLAEGIEAEEEASRIDPKPRCEELCTLADAICALEERVCSLADEHAWDQRYADACTRAGEDCVAAQDACSTCRP